jgi:mannose-1-phosphate guanylyltransferase
MLPILGKPMIERKIAHLVEHGVDDIVMSMGYRPDAFQVTYPNNRCAGARLTYVIEPEPLDTAGAIAYAAREAGIDETFMAMNGDTIIDLDIEELLQFHRSHGSEGTIALTPVEDPSRFGVVPTESDGRVIAFIEKPPRDEAPTNLINAGTYVLEPSVLDRVPVGQKVSIERQVFPEIVADGKLYAGKFGNYWLDIGTPEAYVQGNTDALDRDFGGDAFVDPTASVASNATVKRSVVDKDVRIGAGVTLVDAVLLPGAVVEDGVTVERSVIAENAVVGTGASVTNFSVVGAGQQVAANTALDNEKVNPPGV